MKTGQDKWTIYTTKKIAGRRQTTTYHYIITTYGGKNLVQWSLREDVVFNKIEIFENEHYIYLHCDDVCKKIHFLPVQTFVFESVQFTIMVRPV